MSVERCANASNLVELLDRVLEKGVVFDAASRTPRAGIDLVAPGGRVVATVVVAPEPTTLPAPPGAGGSAPPR